jgi:pyruvate dehydrogenase E2 component (dihydrolipoamide acetyltransferase)
MTDVGQAQEALVEIGMPKLSDSMEEATVLAWLKQPGEAVRRGEPLVEVETDKATVVYEAEASGVLEEIVVGDGETARLGAVIARMRSAAGPPAERPAPSAVPAAPALPPAVSARAGSGRPRATPVARRLAGELGVALGAIEGTGPGGRIVRADVRAAAGNGAATPAGTGRGPVTEIQHTPTQRTIAQRMAESRSSIPEFTLESEITMDAAARLREDLRAGGIDPLPSYNDLVVRAAALALREFPALNASYAEGKVLRFGRINVGIAVATDDALIVPTVLDADRKSVLELAVESRRLAERARSRTLSAAELADGTFTVSNLGMFGVRRFDAVINHPQAAILAVGEVAPRPAVAADGQLVARTTMEVALSCDHRVVYGAEAARFLQRLRALLEHPTLLLVDTGRD